MIPIPQNLDAEKALIGSCLIEPSAVRAMRQIILSPEFFYLEKNRDICRAIMDLAKKGAAIDVVTVDDHMGASGLKDYLIDCLNSVQTAAHAEYYAKIVARCHYEREMIVSARKLAVDMDARQIERLRDIVIAKEGLEAPGTFSYQRDIVSVMDEILTPGKKNKIYPLGIYPLDQIFYGCREGEVTTWGGATNTGKSLMLTNLALIAGKAGERCLYVSTEMRSKDILSRHLSISSGVEAWRLRKCIFEKSHTNRLMDAARDILSQVPLEILDNPEPNISMIESAIVHTKAKVIFLDYLERMDLPGAENMRLAIKEFMRQVKNLAMRHSVVIHLASQLNRRTYAAQTDIPPTLADLSESSAIEKESDRVFLFWQPTAQQTEDETAGRALEVILAKDRNGIKGVKAALRLDSINLRITGEHSDPVAQDFALNNAALKENPNAL